MWRRRRRMEVIWRQTWQLLAYSGMHVCAIHVSALMCHTSFSVYVPYMSVDMPYMSVDVPYMSVDVPYIFH
jgi:hypothetical protein